MAKRKALKDVTGDAFKRQPTLTSFFRPGPKPEPTPEPKPEPRPAAAAAIYVAIPSSSARDYNEFLDLDDASGPSEPARVDEDGLDDIFLTQIVEDDLAPTQAAGQDAELVEHGWHRVGPQPVMAHVHDIRCAPADYVDTALAKSLRVNYGLADAKLTGVNVDSLQAAQTQLALELKDTLV